MKAKVVTDGEWDRRLGTGGQDLESGQAGEAQTPGHIRPSRVSPQW